jgi:hypothetical protein
MKTRRDFGTVRVGPRDLVGMLWCAQHGAVRLDQLADLFGQLDGRPVSVDAARKTVTRWLQRGWASSRTVLTGEPPYVWLTQEGMRSTDLRLPAEEPSLATLAHTRDLVAIRLEVQRAWPTALWRPERLIRATVPARAKGVRVPHIPDGEILFDGGRMIAVERERVAKTTERTRNIQMGLLTRRYDYDVSGEPPLRNLAPRYAEVWYYVSPEARSVVERAADSLPDELRGRLRIVEWS